MILIAAIAWSKTMQTTHRTTIPANRVMALFSDRALSFSLARGATFALPTIAVCPKSNRQGGRFSGQ
jgi:hypothetical protein